MEKVQNNVKSYFQTVARLLPQYDEKVSTCRSIADKLADHRRQFEVCRSVDTDVFRCGEIDGALRQLLLKKLGDKVDRLVENLADEIAWFSARFAELDRKCYNCLKSAEKAGPAAEIADQIDWTTHVNQLLKLQSNNAASSLDVITTRDYFRDVPNDDVVDESDEIFGHSNFDSPAGSNLVGDRLVRGGNSFRIRHSEWTKSADDWERSLEIPSRSIIDYYLSVIATQSQAKASGATTAKAAKKK